MGMSACPGCGLPGVLNAHYGVCQPCVLRAKKFALIFLAGDPEARGRAWVARSPDALVRVARRLYARERNRAVSRHESDAGRRLSANGPPTS